MTGELLLLGLLAGLLPPSERTEMTVAQAVAEALRSSPDLLDAVDSDASARANLSGVRSLFLPQVRPFYQRTAGARDADSTTSFGASLWQQFTFGTRLDASVSASTSPQDGGYSTVYSITASQPLLQRADPVVTREPLRQAERSTQAQTRALTVLRRRTVLQTWSAFLTVVAADEFVRIARAREERAEKLVAASDAKLSAGTLSRLDVLRATQMLSSARSQSNDARNSRDEAHDTLGRLLGRPPSARFVVVPATSLPVTVPSPEDAEKAAIAGREDLQEERDRLRDAEIALRIAKSMVLPSVDAVAGWSANGSATSIGGSLTTPGKAATTLGLRSVADLNLGSSLAQKTVAGIALSGERRRLRTMEDDVRRGVQQSARRLETNRERLAIDQANLEVARLQLEVATLRFERGLNDNFNVIDAENLFNSAQTSLLSSRQTVLLSELDLLFVSSLLRPEDFTPKAP